MPIELGVFLIPPAEHPFYQTATAILGYDVWTRQRVPSVLADDLDAETLTRWLSFSPSYGVHCTIAGGNIWYDEADQPEIEARLAWIASRTAPFQVVNGRFDEAFHANPRVLVTTFDSPDGALQRLHRQVATTVSPLYVSTTCAAPRPPHDDDRARELYTRTGESWALERFMPHWSLLTGVQDAASRDRAIELIRSRTGLFADERTRTQDVRDIHLVRRGEDGFFFVAASFPFSGA